MQCNNCGQSIDIDSNFCKNCGIDLKNIFTGSEYSAFAGVKKATGKRNADFGFLLVAILLLVNLLIRIAWVYLNIQFSQGNRLPLLFVQILSAILLISTFIILFHFTKRKNYKITIGIFGGLALIHQVINIINMITVINRF